MKNLLYAIIFIAFAAGLNSCKPEEILPPKSDAPLTSITATVSINGFDDLAFTGYPDAENRIYIDFPYYYPEASDNATPETAIAKSKISAELANNCTIVNPSIILDLNKEHRIKVLDQLKKEHEYVLSGRIKKSSACDISEFKLVYNDLAGVLKGEEIVVVSVDALPSTLAKVTLSPHATISPDPTKVALDYNSGVEFKVTAHDGTVKTYTVKKGVPGKLAAGLRAGSAKILFAKKLADLGITTDNLTTGIAISGDNLVINTRAADFTLIDRMTGEKKGTVALDSDHKGSLRNFYVTSDDAGHIFLCNLVANDGNVFKIWKFNDVSSSPELYLSWNSGTNAFGRKFSVRGDITKDAVITAPCHTNPTKGFYRWVVKGGVIQNDNKPYWLSAGWDGSWNMNVDICHLEPSPDSDYFVHAYSNNQLTRFDGSTNAVKAQLGKINTNFVPNAVDIVSFNKVHYLATNQLNSFSWGGADYVWLLDVTNEGEFTGTLDAGDVPAVKWFSFNEYGAKAIGNPVNANALSDVKLAVSDNGYYLYLYFMFCNGYVVGVQFDCIEM